MMWLYMQKRLVENEELIWEVRFVRASEGFNFRVEMNL